VPVARPSRVRARAASDEPVSSAQAGTTAIPAQTQSSRAEAKMTLRFKAGTFREQSSRSR
jgi:hypothetical protein